MSIRSPARTPDDALRLDATRADDKRPRSMNERQHAHLAKVLIQACGGFDEAIDACRVGRTQLYQYADPASGHFMPADVMADLEAYCGRPVYSRTLTRFRPAAEVAANAVAEACDVGQAGMRVQELVRRLAGDGELSENDKRQIEGVIAQAEAEIQELRAAVDGRGA